MSFRPIPGSEDDARTADGREWWPTFYDTLRWLIRGGVPNTAASVRRALLSIDAHEQGMTTGEWAEELAKRAAATANVTGVEGETVEQKMARLEAENARLQGLAHARTAGALPPDTDAPSA